MATFSANAYETWILICFETLVGFHILRARRRYYRGPLPLKTFILMLGSPTLPTYKDHYSL